MVDQNKIAIYATADEKYLPYAIVALSSFTRHFPFLTTFLASDANALSSKAIALLETQQIRILHMESPKIFYSEKKCWPSIVYAMLEAPEQLAKQGFSYSIGIDADTFCLKKFHLHLILEQTQNFAGIVNQESILTNILNYPKFSSEIMPEPANSYLVNPNTGCIFWNNLWAQNFELYKKAKELFFKTRQLIVPGDQALLAALILIYQIKYTPLDNSYNFRTGNIHDLRLPIKAQQIKVAHFTAEKPWEPLALRTKTDFHRLFLKLYLRHAWQRQMKKQSSSNDAHVYQ